MRDSDKSVIQFSYGEDGMDISKAQFLKEKQMNFLGDNCKAIVNKKDIKKLKNVDDYDNLEAHMLRLSEWKKVNGDPMKRSRISPFTKFSCIVRDKLSHIENVRKISKTSGRERLSKQIVNLWYKADDELKQKFGSECERCPDTPNSLFQPDCYYGSLNERLMGLMEQFGESRKGKRRREFQDMVKMKAMRSLCAPGEPVGLLAAQVGSFLFRSNRANLKSSR